MIFFQKWYDFFNIEHFNFVTNFDFSISVINVNDFGRPFVVRSLFWIISTVEVFGKEQFVTNF